MEASHTWRELLKRIINDPSERLRIAEMLGVNAITLIRWANGISNPRQDSLRTLLAALPQYRNELTRLIAEEYPQFFTGESLVEDSQPEIPTSFYAHVLHAYTTSPPILRTAAVNSLVTQQMLSQLDPYMKGLVVLIAQCVPPADGQKVRSLRITHYRTTIVHEQMMEHQTLFMGAESQVGNALSSAHRSLMQSKADMQRLFPTHHFEPNASSVAYPILLSNRAAGSLYIASSQPDYFSQAYLDLISNYVNLMTLAFELNDFYDLKEIELVIMPPYRVQQSRLTNFQERVKRYMLDAVKDQRLLIRPQAELAVWRQLEDEFISLAMNSKI